MHPLTSPTPIPMQRLRSFIPSFTPHPTPPCDDLDFPWPGGTEEECLSLQRQVARQGLKLGLKALRVEITQQS